MQNRFLTLFNSNKKKVFIPFFTLGDPDFQTSLEIIDTVIKDGVDALELGFPFSDPIADGPVNQRSMQRALKSGMTFNKCLEMLSIIRNKYPHFPIGLLLYYNLLFKSGESGYKKLGDIGIDAIVSADLPYEESKEHYKLLAKYKIGSVNMIPPNISEDRIRLLSKNTTAFNYVITSLGTTGAKKIFSNVLFDRLKFLKKISTIPLVVGFGISNKDQAEQFWNSGADAVIIGSKYTKIIEDNLNNKLILGSISNFTKNIIKDI